MRIGYVLGQFPKHSETFILNEIVALLRSGHEVRIFSLFDPHERWHHPEVAKLGLLDRTVYLPRSFRLLLDLWRARSLWRCRHPHLKNKLICLAAASYFGARAQADRLDVLHAHFANEPAFTAMLMSRLTRIPYTFTGHAFDIYIHPDKAALRERMAHALRVITPSYFNRAYLHDLTGIPEEKIAVVRACSNLERFGRGGGAATRPIILTAGRLVEKKGIVYGIRAMPDVVRDFPDAEFHVVGNGPLRAALESQARELGLEDRVKFLGSLDGEALAADWIKPRYSSCPASGPPTATWTSVRWCCRKPCLNTRRWFRPTWEAFRN